MPALSFDADLFFVPLRFLMCRSNRLLILISVEVAALPILRDIRTATIYVIMVKNIDFEIGIIRIDIPNATTANLNHDSCHIYTIPQSGMNVKRDSSLAGSPVGPQGRKRRRRGGVPCRCDSTQYPDSLKTPRPFLGIFR